MTAHHTTTPAAFTLPEAVAALVDPQQRRVIVDGLSTRQVTIRAVLDELAASAQPSGQGGGGGRGGGAAASLEAIDLLDRIRETAGWGMAAAGLTPRLPPARARRCVCGWAVAQCGTLRTYGHVCCRWCEHPPPTHPVADALRRVAVHPWPDPAVPARLAWVVARLTGQAAAFLAGDASPDRYVRDTRCPRCRIRHVRGEVDGWTQRHPALRVTVRARAEGVLCAACGHWWPWGEVTGGSLAAELAADAGRQVEEGLGVC
jgi:hypothetical protein